uniref:Putative NDBP n=1 Tax=Superstitionia donensis TaxID=311983 RepID=A0A1V1WBL1_9SCOR
MNAKVFLVVFIVAMLVTDQAEAGFWKNIWNSDIVKNLRNKAVNWVKEKVGAPQVAKLDEFLDSVYNS